MCYEDAILDAICDLKDDHTGSSVNAIQKHIQANFFHDNLPTLDDTEADLLSVEMSSHSHSQWKEHLFVQALKSLIDKHCIVYSPCVKNGSTLYKLSHDYKKHQVEELTQRMERLNQYKLHQQEMKRQRQTLKGKTGSTNKTMAAATGVAHKATTSSNPLLKKGHLVESHSVTIVGKGSERSRKSSMELDREKQTEKRLALPHLLSFHAEDGDVPGGGGKKKGLRDQCKIPHGKIYVKEM
jgi:hypothetical protein